MHSKGKEREGVHSKGKEREGVLAKGKERERGCIPKGRKEYFSDIRVPGAPGYRDRQGPVRGTVHRD